MCFRSEEAFKSADEAADAAESERAAESLKESGVEVQRMPCGLANLGDTCYANAVMQLLFSVSELKSTVRRIDFLASSTSSSTLQSAEPKSGSGGGQKVFFIYSFVTTKTSIN